MNRSLMVVGAHADDIEIIAGGTVAKYHARGYKIVYVMSTNNMSGNVSTLQPDGSVHSRNDEGPVLMMARRKRECDVAAAALGTKPIHLDHPQRHYNGPNGKQIKLRFGCALPEGVPADVPSILTAYEDPASVKRLADLILETAPEIIITHGISQENIEHIGTALLVTKAYWQAVDAGYKGGLIHGREAFTFLGDINTRWETYIDYTPFLDKKMELIGLHACQMPKAHLPTFGHRDLAKQWGSVCGCTAAEVYTWVKRPERDFIDGHGRMWGDLSFELIQNSR